MLLATRLAIIHRQHLCGVGISARLATLGRFCAPAVTTQLTNEEEAPRGEQRGFQSLGTGAWGSHGSTGFHKHPLAVWFRRASDGTAQRPGMRSADQGGLKRRAIKQRASPACD